MAPDGKRWESENMQMRDPPHPGEGLGKRLKPFGVSVTAAAKFLGVPRKALSDILNRRSGVSADMAIRLEKAGLGSARSWLELHLEYNLWKARLRAEINFKEFPPRGQRF